MWSEQVAGMGRERQKNFLEYCQRMIRENFIFNLHQRNLTYMTINEQNFASADSVKEYVSNIIEETVLDVLDEHIDAALDRKLGGIDSEDLTNIFQGGN